LSIIKYAIFFCVVVVLAGPAPGADIPRPSWEYYLEKGTLQFRGGMYDYAELSFRRCLDINERCYQAANYLGEIYLKREQRLQSLEYYRKSLAVNDSQADIHNVAGELCESLSERDDAFRHFTRAVEIDPLHVKANCSLVRYYLARGDRAAAERHFDASYRQARAVSGALLDRARDAIRSRRPREAADLYRRAMDEAPSLIEAYLGMYELCRSRGDYAPAVSALERLAFVKPDYEKAYVLLGYVYFTQKLPGSRKRHIDLALADLKKAVELNPDNCETYYSISEIYHYLKKDVEAKAWEERGQAVEKRAGEKKGR
jgi:tetratricopeptide (TPR) repeat protein